MDVATVNSIEEMVGVADHKLENLNARLRAKSWQTHECEGDHLVRGENELKQEINAAQTELKNLRLSLLMVKTQTGPTLRV